MDTTTTVADILTSTHTECPQPNGYDCEARYCTCPGAVTLLVDGHEAPMALCWRHAKEIRQAGLNSRDRR